MKKSILTLVGAAALVLAPRTSHAIVITFTPGTPSAIANGGSLASTPGTVGIGEVATYVSGGNGLTGIATCWLSGTACDPGGMPVSSASAASNIDHYWLQYDPGILYSFGSPTSSVVAVAGVDHFGPGEVPGEALEFIVWGSNAAGALLEEGAIVAVYDLGVDAGPGTIITGPGGVMDAATSDDFSSLWKFNGSYSYFVVKSGDHLLTFDSPGEGEIDGLAKPAPEPGSLALLVLGVLGAAAFRRKS
jgi:hypothetical protein